MLDYLHSTTLEMLKEIVEILDKNGIRYMICGGTLLGATTTGKFIPWDDDVDMCVLEEDYDKMKRCLIEALPENMYVQCDETEPHYYHGWVKVRDVNSVVYPNESMYNENGVWVDIYKLKKAYRKDVDWLILQEHIDYLKRRWLKGCISREEQEKRMLDNNLASRLQEAKFDASHCKSSDEVYVIWSASKILVEKEWCMPLSEIMFQNMKVTTFNNPQMYLERHYGVHYMNLPPDDRRRVGINNVAMK